ncbi:amidase [Advenella sp. WQ 585]|uniref:Amidase n=1 Tax=Advenella mandrilli TaxID=2800330 RepID=A0ABS1E817_9BURK|nr:amidase [Advenella mandrilli]MBK1779702.1 amidase [Advenella mandrilli]
MKRQWFKLPLHQLLQALNAGEANLPEVVTSFYERTAKRDGQIGAWQYLIDQEDYLAEYESRREFYDASPLKGLPFAVKDVIDTADIPTTMGSVIHQDRIPDMDASCVTAMKAAGGILMGKTVTTEFAYFQAGKTNNPHDPERTPGGSSSGSAAAVADYMVPIAFGTQTAASVIRPASYCGCVGYVGSKNEFSLRNIQPLAQSLDSLGIISNDVLDTVLVRNILLHKSLEPMPQASPLPYTFGVFTGEVLGPVQDKMLETLAGCQQELAEKGHRQVDFPLQETIAELTTLHGQVMAFEVARNLEYEQQHETLGSHMQALIGTGLAFPYSDYIAALQKADAMKQTLLQWFDKSGADFILAPAAPGVAPYKTEGTGTPFMSRAWQLAGLPVVSLPLGYYQKMPMGLQLIGKPHQDDLLLLQARQLQQLFLNEHAAVAV